MVRHCWWRSTSKPICIINGKRCQSTLYSPRPVLPPAAAWPNFTGKHSHFPRRKVCLSDMTAVYTALVGALRPDVWLQIRPLTQWDIKQCSRQQPHDILITWVNFTISTKKSVSSGDNRRIYGSNGGPVKPTTGPRRNQFHFIPGKGFRVGVGSGTTHTHTHVSLNPKEKVVSILKWIRTIPVEDAKTTHGPLTPQKVLPNPLTRATQARKSTMTFYTLPCSGKCVLLVPDPPSLE